MSPHPCQHLLLLCNFQMSWKLQVSLLTFESCDSVSPCHCVTVSFPFSSPCSPVDFCSLKQGRCLTCA